jgi:hypothetical protein
MIEAWQKRESEQQELVERLMRNAFRFNEDGDSEMFFMALAVELTGNFIADRFADRGEDILPSLAVKIGDRLIERYCTEVRAKVKEFSRTQEEERELLARLLLKFTEAGLSDVHSNYLRQKVHEQEKLYEGHRAMDEVPL